MAEPAAGSAAEPAVAPPERWADLVLEGGGAKGFALVGAVQGLAAGGYRVARVAGTSAGALTAAVVAALGAAGEPLGRLADVTATFDVARVRERGPVGRALGPLGVLADAASLLRRGGLADGHYARKWLGGVLGDLGVVTFADLRLSGQAAVGVPEGRRWSLVVTATDVSRGRAALLPWDYPRYGLEPDAQPVVGAVAASAALPAVITPVHLRARSAAGRGADVALLDGGLLSNYPITVFDRRDGAAPRWPTLGVRLTSADQAAARPRRVRGLPSLVPAVLATLVEAGEARLVEDPCVLERTITVDTGAVRATDFGLSPRAREQLRARGEQAARAFLTGFDWPAHRQRCRGCSGAAG